MKKQALGRPVVFPKGTYRINLHVDPRMGKRIDKALKKLGLTNSDFDGRAITKSDFVRRAISDLLAKTGF